MVFKPILRYWLGYSDNQFGENVLSSFTTLGCCRITSRWNGVHAVSRIWRLLQGNWSKGCTRWYALFNAMYLWSITALSCKWKFFEKIIVYTRWVSLSRSCVTAPMMKHCWRFSVLCWLIPNSWAVFLILLSWLYQVTIATSPRVQKFILLSHPEFAKNEQEVKESWFFKLLPHTEGRHRRLLV